MFVKFNDDCSRLGLVTTIVDGYCRWFSSNSGGKFFEQVLAGYGLECVFHLKLCSPGVRVLLLLW